MDTLDLLLAVFLVVGGGILALVLGLLGWASLVGMLGGPDSDLGGRLSRLLPGMGG